MRSMLIALLIAACSTSLQAQERVVSAGGGAVPEAKYIKKRVCIVEEGTNKPLSGVYFTIAHDNTALTGGKTDSTGCAVLKFRMDRYFSKVVLNLNDNTYMRPEWPENRNKIAYQPVNTKIAFKSQSESDTTFIRLKLPQ